MTRKRTPAVMKRSLFSDVRRMIEEARSAVAVTVNAGLTILYWQIGNRIDQETLKGDRAEYGGEIVATLSRQLVEAYGRGFAEKNLRRMVQFAHSFPDAPIVAALSRQLSWSHFKELLPLKSPSSASSTPRCAASKAGAYGHCARRLMGCSTSGRRSQMLGSGSRAD